LSTDFPTENLIEDLISQAEAARLRGVTRQAIRKLVEVGRLRSYTIGGRNLVLRSEVRQFVPHKPGRPKNPTKSKKLRKQRR